MGEVSSSSSKTSNPSGICVWKTKDTNYLRVELNYIVHDLVAFVQKPGESRFIKFNLDILDNNFWESTYTYENKS